VLGEPPRDHARFWRAVALVAGEPTCYPGLTVREHLELVRRTHEPIRGWWPAVNVSSARSGSRSAGTPSRSTFPRGNAGRIDGGMVAAQLVVSGLVFGT
jgi:ABC-2 type transport system ATP-binding protein